MNNKLLIALIVIVVLLGASAGYFYFYQTKVSTPNTQTNNSPLVGSDKDAHGCIGSAGYSWCEAKQKCLRSWEETCETTATSTPTEQNAIMIDYKNTQYGFSFTLPPTWKNYTINNTTWTGNPMGGQTGPAINGPEIIIRHPLWTEENPRQDIPIMIFTLAQWNLIQQEKISLGAAPIGPSELGRNTKYVFALPARYNFAFPTGFEEVDRIINSKPLRSF